MELKAYWLALKAGWMIILGALLVAVAVGALLTWPTTPQYVSSTRFFVAANTGSEDLSELFERNAVAQQRVASYVVLATSASVAADASDALGFPVSSGAVTATLVPETVIIELSVTDSDPERAHDIATAYGEVLPEAIESLEQVGDASTTGVRLTVIDEAGLPTSPVPTPVRRTMMVVLILGLGAGIGLAVVRYALVHGDTSAPPPPGAGAA